jgi:C-terminal processing protease CtpA/Prc
MIVLLDLLLWINFKIMIKFNNPKGDETQHVSILPDIEVKLTIAGIRLGKDELLEKAIEVIGNE